MTAITLKVPTRGKHDSSLRLQSLTNKCFAYNNTPYDNTRKASPSALTTPTNPDVYSLVRISQPHWKLSLSLRTTAEDSLPPSTAQPHARNRHAQRTE